MIDVLFDPLLRGPFWGIVILSILLAITGVLTFFAKKPLLGEVVAHCSYPGAIFGLIASLILSGLENPLLILLVAFVFAYLGSYFLKKLEAFHTSDSSMTLVLSGFFGLGVLLSSIIQQKYSKFYRLAQGYLFGQVSTMTDLHIWIYGVCLILCLMFVYLFFEQIKLKLFDPLESQFLKGQKIDYCLEALICLCLVLGIRGIGVVLVSSFFVAPAAFTLRFCKTFKSSLLVAVIMSAVLSSLVFIMPFKAPIGPAIVLLMSFVSFLSLTKRSHAPVH